MFKQACVWYLRLVPQFIFITAITLSCTQLGFGDRRCVVYILHNRKTHETDKYFSIRLLVLPNTNHNGVNHNRESKRHKIKVSTVHLSDQSASFSFFPRNINFKKQAIISEGRVAYHSNPLIFLLVLNALPFFHNHPNFQIGKCQKANAFMIS